jgi:tetratricopeptide (TPR) repeat protein
MNTINIKQIMVRIFLLIAVLSFSFATYAKEEFITFDTVFKANPDRAHGYRLGNDVWGIWNSIKENIESDKKTKHKNFDKALIRADKVIENFKSIFDKNKTQYVFEYDSHYEKFIKINGSDFQRIDSAYKEALQIKAYIYSDLKKYEKAIENLKKVQAIAPTSAMAFIEHGYVHIANRSNILAASTYLSAKHLANKYPEGQSKSKAAALRGLGFVLIESGELDKAKMHYEESLEIDPGNKTAINELKYISSVSPDKWKHITDDWYIDTSSIEKKDGNIFVWQMLNSEGTYKPTQTPVLSTSLLYEYDCNANTYTSHGIKMYEKEMGKGKLIANYRLQGEVADVPSSPTTQLLYKEACSYLNN